MRSLAKARGTVPPGARTGLTCSNCPQSRRIQSPPRRPSRAQRARPASWLDCTQCGPRHGSNSPETLAAHKRQAVTPCYARSGVVVRAKVAVVRTTPQTVLEDYRRVLDLSDCAPL